MTGVQTCALPIYKLDKTGKKQYRDEYGKRINQTLITGGGAGVLVKKYKMDESDVREKVVLYFRALPEIKPFQKKAERLFRQRGYMLSLLGRRMQLEADEYAYRATNRLIQGGNADCLKWKMVQVGEYLHSLGDCGVEMLMNCHDAVTFNFDEDARPVYDRCLTMMEDFHSDDALIKLNIPIVVDRGEGSNWAEATWGSK